MTGACTYGAAAGREAIETWAGTDGAGCGSAEEFLLKASAALGLGEEGLADAVADGLPLASLLQFNPRLAAGLIRDTKVFDRLFAMPDGLGFWSLKRSVDGAIGPLNSPDGAYAVMKAFFEKEKALRAKSRPAEGHNEGGGEDMDRVFERIENEALPEIEKALGHEGLVVAKGDGLIRFRIAADEDLSESRGAGKWREFIRGKLLGAGAAEARVSPVASPAEPGRRALYSATAWAEPPGPAGRVR